MIIINQMITLIVNACPSCAYLVDQEELAADCWYPLLGRIGSHIVELLERNEVTDFPALFAVIERLSLEGDDYVREATVIGLLESIQNHAGHRDVDADIFRQYLLPNTAYFWDELIDFWQSFDETNRQRPGTTTECNPGL